MLVAQQQAAAAAAAAAAARARLAAQQGRPASAAQQAAERRPSSSRARAARPASGDVGRPRRLQRAATPEAAAATATASAPSPLGWPRAPVSAPPPVGSGAAGAVAAAESRVGDPYVWGAAGPGAFDCSGLVMWAYAQVGISLPHFSGAQYADTTHIPMSELEPGDLVFPADPGQHVAMYVGNGDDRRGALHRGRRAHRGPMSSWFVLASRVE